MRTCAKKVCPDFNNRVNCCGTQCSPCAKQKEGTSKPDAAALLSLVNETVPGYVKAI